MLRGIYWQLPTLLDNLFGPSLPLKMGPTSRCEMSLSLYTAYYTRKAKISLEVSGWHTRGSDETFRVHRQFRRTAFMTFLSGVYTSIVPIVYNILEQGCINFP